MKDTLPNRKLPWWPAAALLVLVLVGSSRALAQPPGSNPDVYYYHRVKIDTPANSSDANDQKNAAEHWAVSDNGNTIRILGGKGYNDPGSVWKAQPEAGKALLQKMWDAKQEGTANVTWTVPPEYLSSEQDLTLSITVVAQTDWWSVAKFATGPAERFQPGAEKTIVGKNPFDRVQAETSAGSATTQQGSITVRPKQNAGDFSIWLSLEPSYGFGVSYHYVQMPRGTVPPKLPPGPGNPPPPTGGCEHTFAKTWDSAWGKWTFHINGNQATGTYANRKGQYGPGTVTGILNGNVIDGTWKDAHGSGTIHLVLSDDGCTVSGTHTTNPPDTSGGGTGPTLTDPGSHGPSTGPGPPDPPTDPTGQGCIDQWIKLAMSILNRRDKSNSAPNGPWRVSEYGQLVGHGVSSAGPPDGWDTTYQRNRYAFIWATWQQSNTDPSYGGELPSLKSYVEDCQSKHGPPPGPGTTGYPPGTDPTTPMTLLAENRTVLAGDSVLVPVWLVNGADVANINFTVGYDANVATSDGDPGKGNLLGEALFSANPQQSGLIRLGFAQSKGLTGTGTVAYLPFKAVGKPGDRTPLHLEVQIINNPGGTLLTIARIDGSITIVGPDGLVPGDCDCDGALTTVDAKCALDMSVKLIPEKMNMDMDGDGQVTSRDATIILQRRAMFLAKGGQ